MSNQIILKTTLETTGVQLIQDAKSGMFNLTELFNSTNEILGTNRQIKHYLESKGCNEGINIEKGQITKNGRTKNKVMAEPVMALDAMSYIDISMRNAIYEAALNHIEQKYKGSDINEKLNNFFNENINYFKKNEKELNISTYIVMNEKGLYKIGKTTNFDNRIKTLKSNTGNDNDNVIMPICLINGDFESKLHKVFKDKNIKGEWFRLSDDDIIEALEISNTGKIKLFLPVFKTKKLHQRLHKWYVRKYPPVDVDYSFVN